MATGRCIRTGPQLFVFARGSEPLLPEKTHEVGECHAL